VVEAASSLQASRGAIHFNSAGTGVIEGDEGALKQIPPKWMPVRRRGFAQHLEVARCLVDQMSPSGRKAR
jgi:hypothetical protein